MSLRHLVVNDVRNDNYYTRQKFTFFLILIRWKITSTISTKRPNAIIGDWVLTKEYVWFVLFENEYFIKLKTPNKKYV